MGSTGDVGGVGVGEGRLQQEVCCSVRDETGGWDLEVRREWSVSSLAYLFPSPAQLVCTQ